MREIKFRYTVDVGGGTFIHGDFDFSKHMEWVVPEWFKRNGLELGPHVYKRQWVGLKDRSGVDIYEGDIVRVPGMALMETVFQIEFYRGSFGFGFHPNLEFWHLTFLNNDDIEVIGNIYEHPELMEGEQ